MYIYTWCHECATITSCRGTRDVRHPGLLVKIKQSRQSGRNTSGLPLAHVGIRWPPCRGTRLQERKTDPCLLSAPGCLCVYINLGLSSHFTEDSSQEQSEDIYSGKMISRKDFMGKKYSFDNAMKCVILSSLK